MTKRESRVINAFINCVKSGEFSEDYAITLIEDQQKYGWLSEEAKEVFYEALEPAPEPEPEPTPEPDLEVVAPEEFTEENIVQDPETFTGTYIEE